MRKQDILEKEFEKTAKLPENVIVKQLERMDLSYSRIGDEQNATITEAGLALVKANLFPP